MTTLCIKFIKD